MIHNLQLLHLYKPPPPYPSNRPSSNSTPDLASKTCAPPQPSFINPHVSIFLVIMTRIMKVEIKLDKLRKGFLEYYTKCKKEWKSVTPT